MLGEEGRGRVDPEIGVTSFLVIADGVVHQDRNTYTARVAKPCQRAEEI